MSESDYGGAVSGTLFCGILIGVVSIVIILIYCCGYKSANSKNSSNDNQNNNNNNQDQNSGFASPKSSLSEPINQEKHSA